MLTKVFLYGNVVPVVTEPKFFNIFTDPTVQFLEKILTQKIWMCVYLIFVTPLKTPLNEQEATTVSS